MEYILKFSIVLFVLVACYKLLLEKTTWHRFKRYYLLVIPLLAAVLPLITVRTTYIEPAPVVNRSISSPAIVEQSPAPIFQDREPLLMEENHTQETSIKWMEIAAFAYMVILLLMLARFVKQLRRLRIYPSDRVDNYCGATLVVRNEKIAAHSFWNRIYISEELFENPAAKELVLKHELAHLRQRHSVDIVLAQLLVTVLWWHPAIYFWRNAIKENHEYLADQAVLAQGVPVKSYRETLLQYIDPAYTGQLAHAINFSSIKNRFEMMNSKSKTKSLFFRTVSTVLITVGLLVACGKEKVVEIDDSVSAQLAYLLENDDETKRQIENGELKIQEYASEFTIDEGADSLQTIEIFFPKDFEYLKTIDANRVEIERSTKNGLETITIKKIQSDDKVNLIEFKTKSNNLNYGLPLINAFSKKYGEKAKYFHEGDEVSEKTMRSLLNGNTSFGFKVEQLDSSSPSFYAGVDLPKTAVELQPVYDKLFESVDEKHRHLGTFTYSQTLNTAKDTLTILKDYQEYSTGDPIYINHSSDAGELTIDGQKYNYKKVNSTIQFYDEAGEKINWYKKGWDIRETLDWKDASFDFGRLMENGIKDRIFIDGKEISKAEFKNYGSYSSEGLSVKPNSDGGKDYLFTGLIAKQSGQY